MDIYIPLIYDKQILQKARSCKPQQTRTNDPRANFSSGYLQSTQLSICTEYRLESCSQALDYIIGRMDPAFPAPAGWLLEVFVSFALFVFGLW